MAICLCQFVLSRHFKRRS